MRALVIILIVLGIITLLPALAPDGSADDGRSSERVAAAVTGVVLLIAGIIIGSVRAYNGLVAAHVRCDKTWSNIDVLLKRRHDLIDNLVATVRRYAEHEQTTFTEVARYRSQATQTADVVERGNAEAGLQSAAGQLLAVAESYPDLKADAHFRDLSSQLTSTEDDIATSRQAYNDTTEAANTLVRKFPNVLYASLFGFKERGFFQVDHADRSVPAAAV